MGILSSSLILLQPSIVFFFLFSFGQICVHTFIFPEIIFCLGIILYISYKLLHVLCTSLRRLILLHADPYFYLLKKCFRWLKHQTFGSRAHEFSSASGFAVLCYLSLVSVVVFPPRGAKSPAAACLSDQLLLTACHQSCLMVNSVHLQGQPTVVYFQTS